MRRWFCYPAGRLFTNSKSPDYQALSNQPAGHAGQTVFPRVYFRVSTKTVG